MSFSGRQENGGRFPGGFDIPPAFNISAPFIILPLSTVTGPARSTTTVSTLTTSTLLTTSYQTISMTASIIVTQTSPVTVIPTASLAAQQAAIQSNASLTRTNTVIVGVLCGFIIILILALGLFTFIWVRRRRQERQDGSPPLTSLALESPQATRSQQAHGQPTSLSLGLRGALSSNPPNSNRLSFSRPFGGPVFNENGSQSNPALQELQLPTINLQPNTPSVTGRDDNAPISPILQAGPARMPFYHESLHDAAAEEISRLGVPATEQESSRRHSSVSVGSEFEDRGTGNHTPEHREGVLHSTRASSGVFPES